MSAPLLATKFYVPPPGKYLVDRAHLLQKLDGCLQPGCRLTLLSAPPGFGKTTLTSAWVAHVSSMQSQRLPHIAWLSLDDGDNDPAVFWTYVVSALQIAQAGMGQQALNLLEAGSPPNLEGVLASLVNSLVELSNPFILILDDYHLIRIGEVHKSLSFLIAHMPPPFHVLLLSRTDPPLPLALLRGRGQLLEIRLADLRFSSEEAALYLNEGLKLALLPEAVTLLNTKTEGWAAGLQMAGISLQGRPDSTQFVQTFSGSDRHILDYLSDEILDRQPDEVRTFLLHTSVFERLSAPLCDAVLGESADWRAFLERLEKANLFLIPLDNERIWFRYHHLFADLLRAKLAQSDPALTAVLQKRAAAWFEKNGMLEEAVFYTHAARDDDNLARLVEQNILPLIREGRIATLSRWRRLLPEGLVLSRPWLCILSGWLLVTRSEFEKAVSYLDRAEELLRPGMPATETSEMWGILYSLRTPVLQNRGDMPGTIQTAHRAMEFLDPDEIVARSSADYALGQAYYASGDLVQAEQVWSEFAGHAVRAGIRSIYAILNSVRSNLLAVRGRLQEAIDLNRQTIDYMVANDVSRFFGSGAPYVNLGILTFQRDDLVEAAKAVDEGVRQNQGWGNLNTIALGLSHQARLRIADGDLDAAGACLRDAKQILQRFRPYFQVSNHYLACCVNYYLARNDIASAVNVVTENGLRNDDPLSFPREQDHITLSRVRIAQERYAEAEGLLGRLAQAAQAGGRFGRLIEILNLRALALRALGRGPEAIQALETSLALGQPEGYVRVFVDHGQPMAALLEMAAQRGIQAEYANRLLAAFPASSRQTPSSMNVQKGNLHLIEPLSAREIEVLRWIETGLSNKEIAQRLSISVRTVKYHTANIYSKLAVTSRSQAVAKAREIGLRK
jgi:LuxR family maltose regulon positive regulatory protein